MTNLKPWHWQQVSIGGLYEILEGDKAKFHVFFAKTAEKIVTELNAQADTIASLQAELAKSNKYSANLADAVRQHLIIWNHICDANRQDNAVILATDTNQAMLNTLDNVIGNFSMVWVSDAFLPLQNSLDGKDSYYIKLHTEMINEQLTEARAEIDNLQKVIADSKAYEAMMTDGSDESTAPVECAHCEGHGYVSSIPRYAESDDHEECADCNGTGLQPADSEYTARIED